MLLAPVVALCCSTLHPTEYTAVAKLACWHAPVATQRAPPPNAARLCCLEYALQKAPCAHICKMVSSRHCRAYHQHFPDTQGGCRRHMTCSSIGRDLIQVLLTYLWVQQSGLQRQYVLPYTGSAMHGTTMWYHRPAAATHSCRLFGSCR